MGGEEIVARARACLGVRFRPQGRDPALGLDCAGLAAIAFGETITDGGYRLRGDHRTRILHAVRAAGLHRIAVPAAGAGTLVLLDAGPEQLHLAILTERGFVHADAALGRVTEVPGAPRWPILMAWEAR